MAYTWEIYLFELFLNSLVKFDSDFFLSLHLVFKILIQLSDEFLQMKGNYIMKKHVEIFGSLHVLTC